MDRHEIEARINALKSKLNETDYKAIKAFEGHPSSDWDTVVAQRESWREEISTLQTQLDALDEYSQWRKRKN